MDWHRYRRFGHSSSLPPQRGDGLSLRIKVQSLFAVEMQIAMETASGSGKTEHGQWNWNWNVNTDLSNIDFVDELPGKWPAGCENGSTVSIRVAIYNLDGIFECIGVHDRKNRPENLFFVAVLVGLYFSQKGWSYEVAVRILVHLDVPSVQNTLGTLKIYTLA